LLSPGRRETLAPAIRASEEETKAGVGISEVSAAFERLDWGVVENTRHDLGTDLFAAVRDERLFDLGLFVGIQVKAGLSYFDEPNREKGGPSGWWFRDSDRSHVDSWVRSGIPHLLVLHDLQTRVSYWVHVTAESIVETGKGAKVLVPSVNTVDEANRVALLKVAATTRPAVVWEGSAWTGASALAERNRLRHALIVPRLIAPHPNSGYEATLTPSRATALLMQARLSDIERFAGKQVKVPSLDEAPSSQHWGWRFVGALSQRVMTGQIDMLAPIAAEAPQAWERCAATAVAAAAFIEEARPDEAIQLLESELARNEADPVDHAWLLMQYARASAEVGRIDDARAAAAEVQVIRRLHSDDVTATAIAGASARLLFDTSSWGQKDVEAVIAGADTAVAWWRTQTVAWGLAALTDRMFKESFRDQSMTLGGSDDANNQLLAASLTANHLGDQGEWRRLSGLLGMDSMLRVTRHSEPAMARAGLSTLRLAGYQDALKLAVRRLVLDGPAAAVGIEAANVRLDLTTRTTGAASLALFESGGDVVDEESADRAVGWLLATLETPEPFLARTDPTYLVVVRLLDTLAALVQAASAKARQTVVEFFLRQTPQRDQLIATSWLRVLYALPESAWDEESALTMESYAEVHHDLLRIPMLSIAAVHSGQARTVLAGEAHSGSIEALAALGRYGEELDAEDIAPLVDRLADQVNETIVRAEANVWGVGDLDAARALADLNARYAEVARWDSLLELLENDAVARRDKAGALERLTFHEAELPMGVRERLHATAIALASPATKTTPPAFPGESDARGEAVGLLCALDPSGDYHPRPFADLLAGDADHRRWAAWAARHLTHSEDRGILLALAQDAEPRVRAAAAGALASIVAEVGGDAVTLIGLAGCLDDPGTLVPRSVAGALARVDARSAAAEEILAGLRDHLSASVRLIVSNG
jgi:hypothetical protein